MLEMPPLYRALIALLIAGAVYPIPGIYLLRMNLLPLRFMLMHGALLGGALSLTLHWPLLGTTLLVIILLLVGITSLTKYAGCDPGQSSLFLMVASLGAAFLLIYRFGLPAKDILTLLWGSPYLLSWKELGWLILWSTLVVVSHLAISPSLNAFFFDRVVARSSGVGTTFLYRWVVFTTAFTIAISMRLLGALLLDALLLLPGIVASVLARSSRSCYLIAPLLGTSFSLVGFALAIFLDIPLVSGVALSASGGFLIAILFSRKRPSLL